MDHVKEFIDYLTYERRLAPTTIKQYKYFISKFNKFISKDCTVVNEKDIRDFIIVLSGSGNCMGSVSNYIISMRIFYIWLAYKNKTEHLRDISFFLNNIIKTKQDHRAPVVPKNDEIERIREVVAAYKQAASFNKNSKEYGVILRDSAIIELLRDAGPRSNELRNIVIKDLGLEYQEVLLRKAKGGSQRVVIFSCPTKDTLKEYISFWNLKSDDWLFPSTHRQEDGITFKMMSGETLNRILRRWAMRASHFKNIHAHLIRHYHGTEARRLGVDLEHIQKQYGHSNINTTMHYVHLDTNSRRENYAPFMGKNNS